MDNGPRLARKRAPGPRARSGRCDVGLNVGRRNACFEKPGQRAARMRSRTSTMTTTTTSWRTSCRPPTAPTRALIPDPPDHRERHQRRVQAAALPWTRAVSWTRTAAQTPRPRCPRACCRSRPPLRGISANGAGRILRAQGAACISGRHRTARRAVAPIKRAHGAALLIHMLQGQTVRTHKTSPGSSTYCEDWPLVRRALPCSTYWIAWLLAAAARIAAWLLVTRLSR